MGKIFILQTDDWVGLYEDGELRYEGHSLSGTLLLEALRIPYLAEWVEQDDFLDKYGGQCPEKFAY